MYIINEYASGSSLNFQDNLSETYKSIIASENYFIIEKQLSCYTPHLISSLIKRIQEKKEIPVILGGDHSITYYAVKKILSTNKDFAIIHFDAHHDEYNEILNHYTVFRHIKENLCIDVIGVGYRQNVKLPSSILTNIYQDVYISIDADYFSPQYVPSVNHPIKTGNPREYSLATLIQSLNHVKAKILCVDFVEWKGAEVNSVEFKFITKVIQSITNKVSSVL